MKPMTDFITYREVREITVRLPRDDYEAERSYGEDIVKAEVISREEIGRRHEIDYSWDCDLEAELYILLADGERVFSHRSHDAVIAHAATLGDDVRGVQLFDDLDDPDRSWRALAEGRKAAEARKADASAKAARTEALWDSVMEGSEPVDESLPISSADINAQTAAEMNRWSR